MNKSETIVKPRVRYLSTQWTGDKILYDVKVGANCYLFPIDHPSVLVSNESIVRTSPVLNFDEDTGEIETHNTIYVPITYEDFRKDVLDLDSEDL